MNDHSTPGLCRDLLYLDLALESAARSLLEGSMADMKAAAPDAQQLPSLLQLLSLHPLSMLAWPLPPIRSSYCA